MENLNRLLETVALPGRSPVSGSHGIVTAMSRDAARAGGRILHDGGNAVDAAVATALASGVSEPSMSGLGGTAYALVHDPARDRTEAVQGTARCPAAAREDLFEPRSGVGGGLYGFPPTRGDHAETGPLSVCAPTAPAVLHALHRRFGRLPLAQVAEPAIRMAAEGIVPDWTFFAHRAAGSRRLGRCPAAARLHVREDGGFFLPAHEQDRLRNPELARSLERFAREGAAPFHSGEPAERLLAGLRADGGILKRSDLERIPEEIRFEAPLRFRYRDRRLATLGGSSGGPTVAQTLLHLDALETPAGDEVAFLHRLAESLRLAFTDRFLHLGDPDSVPVPLDGLLHPDYLAARRRGIDPAGIRADALAEADPSAFGGNPTGPPGSLGAPAGDCTTHINVVDQDGMAVALTATLGGRFGSAWTASGLGYPLNNGMMWFDPRPGTRISTVPGRRALHAAAGVLAFDDAGLAGVAGAPGGRKLISAASLLLARVFEQGASMPEAAGGARMHADVGDLALDERTPDLFRIAKGLRDRGHTVRIVEETVLTGHFGRASGLLRHANGGFEAGVDPIRTAAAVAVADRELPSRSDDKPG